MKNLQLDNILNESSLVSKTDAKGRITFANKKFCEVSGYSWEELEQQDHRLLNSKHHDSDFWNNMYDVTVNGRKIWYGLVKNKAKDGTYYWVKTYIQCLFDKDKIKEFISVRQDVTKEIQQAEEINSERHKLIKLTEELSNKNLKLEEESQGVRDYNLDMERLKANNRLKLLSLIIVLIPVFIIMILIIMLDVDNTKITFVGTLFGILIGTFLNNLINKKNSKKL